MNTLHWPTLFHDHLFSTLLNGTAGWSLDTIPLSILEIGSFEGASSMWFIRYLLGHKDSRLVCIDPWDPESLNNPPSSIPISETLDTFLSNIHLTGYSDQVRAIRGDSHSALATLMASREYVFDVVYIDGSHTSYDVMG